MLVRCGASTSFFFAPHVLRLYLDIKISLIYLNKINKNILVVIIIVLLAGFYNCFRYKEIQKYGVYSIGKVIDKTYHKGIRKEVWFDFSVKEKGNSKRYKSVHSPFFV